MQSPLHIPRIGETVARRGLWYGKKWGLSDSTGARGKIFHVVHVER
jgi:hypothetical protein